MDIDEGLLSLLTDWLGFSWTLLHGYVGYVRDWDIQWYTLQITTLMGIVTAIHWNWAAYIQTKPDVQYSLEGNLLPW